MPHLCLKINTIIRERHVSVSYFMLFVYSSYLYLFLKINNILESESENEENDYLN